MNGRTERHVLPADNDPVPASGSTVGNCNEGAVGHETNGVPQPEWSVIVSQPRSFRSRLRTCSRQLAAAAHAGDDGGHRPIHALFLSIGRRPPKLHTASRILTLLLDKRRRTYQRTPVSRPARGHLVGPARRAGQPPRRRIHDGQRAGAPGWTTRWASRPFWVAAAAMPASNTRAAVNRIGSRAPRRAQDSPGTCSEEVAWENAKLIADLARYPRRRPVEDRREHPRRAGRRQAAPLSPRNGRGGVVDACAAGPGPDTAAASGAGRRDPGAPAPRACPDRRGSIEVKRVGAWARRVPVAVGIRHP